MKKLIFFAAIFIGSLAHAQVLTPLVVGGGCNQVAGLPGDTCCIPVLDCIVRIDSQKNNVLFQWQGGRTDTICIDNDPGGAEVSQSGVDTIFGIADGVIVIQYFNNTSDTIYLSPGGSIGLWRVAGSSGYLNTLVIPVNNRGVWTDTKLFVGNNSGTDTLEYSVPSHDFLLDNNQWLWVKENAIDTMILSSNSSGGFSLTRTLPGITQQLTFTDTDTSININQIANDGHKYQVGPFHNATDNTVEMSIHDLGENEDITGLQLVETGGAGTIRFNFRDTADSSFVTHTMTQSGLLIDGNKSAQGYLRLTEDGDNGTNYMQVQSASSLTADRTITLPSAAPSAGYVITTDGSGNWSYAAPTTISPWTLTGAIIHEADSTDAVYIGRNTDPYAGAIPFQFYVTGEETQYWSEFYNYSVNLKSIISQGAEQLSFEISDTTGANIRALTIGDSIVFTYASAIAASIGTQFNFDTHLNILTGKNIILGTTTGTKIGTSTSQKLGFYNTTPVDQPAAVSDPSGGATQDAEARTAIIAIIDRLVELGLIAP